MEKENDLYYHGTEYFCYDSEEEEEIVGSLYRAADFIYRGNLDVAEASAVFAGLLTGIQKRFGILYLQAIEGMLRRNRIEIFLIAVPINKLGEIIPQQFGSEYVTKLPHMIDRECSYAMIYCFNVLGKLDILNKLGISMKDNWENLAFTGIVGEELFPEEARFRNYSWN